MPTVVILTRADAASTPSAEPVEIAAPQGGSLADLCDDHGAPIPFSCRDANCGTCLVEVLEGAGELFDADAHELALLATIAPASTHRLACCVRMRRGLARVRLRVVDANEAAEEADR